MEGLIARDFASFRVGLAAGHKTHRRTNKRSGFLEERDSTCTNLYTYPDSSTTFDASSGPLKFTWDPNCLPSTATNVDLTLRAPQLLDPVIKIFKDVPASSGSYSATLLPKWWNSSESIQLQMSISPSNTPKFLSNSIAGPAFQVAYPVAQLSTTLAGGSTVAAAAADTSRPDSIVVSFHTKSSDGLNAGSVFAAVFFPIVLVCTGIFLYVRMVRAKQAKKRQRWSQAIDNRMSVISQSWQPGATAGGTPRKSSALSNRTGRSAESTYGGANLAGRGANAGYDFSVGQGQGEGVEQMAEVDPATFARPLTNVFLSQERRSRVVSFAENSGAGGGARTSVAGSIAGGSRVGGGVRARPSVSIHGSSALGRAESDMGLSPEQEQGPWVLGDVSLDGAAVATNLSREEEGIEEMEEEDAYGGMSDIPAAKTINHPTYTTPTTYPVHTSSASTVSAQSFPSPPLSIPPKSYSPALPGPSISTPNTIPGASPAPSAAISSYFPAPPSQTGVDPNILLQQHAAALASASPNSGSTAKRASGAAKRPTVLAGGNNPFRASMAGELGDPTP